MIRKRKFPLYEGTGGREWEITGRFFIFKLLLFSAQREVEGSFCLENGKIHLVFHLNICHPICIAKQSIRTKGKVNGLLQFIYDYL
jgi:hypothetical protein